MVKNSALAVYDSEWDEIVGTNSGVLCVGTIGACTPLTVDVSLD